MGGWGKKRILSINSSPGFSFERARGDISPGDIRPGGDEETEGKSKPKRAGGTERWPVHAPLIIPSGYFGG